MKQKEITKTEKDENSKAAWLYNKVKKRNKKRKNARTRKG